DFFVVLANSGSNLEISASSVLISATSLADSSFSSSSLVFIASTPSSFAQEIVRAARITKGKNLRIGFISEEMFLKNKEIGWFSLPSQPLADLLLFQDLLKRSIRHRTQPDS